MGSISLTSKEYYLWRKNSERSFPWERGIGRVDFLKFEKYQLNNLKKWLSSFNKIKEGILPDLICFVLPVKLDKKTEICIQLEGAYSPKILSVLNNSLQGNVLLLFPKEKAVRDYSLIRLINPKKKFIPYLGSNMGFYGVLVEECEVLPLDKLYFDVGFERKRIDKMISSSIIDDKNLVASFSAPLYGSPFVVNDKGGISLTSILSDSTFSEELLKTLQMIQPPGFRSALPPKKAYLGKNMFCFPGVTARVAERYVNPNHYFSTIMGVGYDIINSELIKRKKFEGEYSIVGSLITYGEGPELLQDLFKRFNSTEITLSGLGELKEADVDLTRAQKEIDESLWAQIAYSKQLNPSFGLPTKVLLSKLKNDWEVFLAEMNYQDSIDIQSTLKAEDTLPNIIRLSKSFARGDGVEDVSEEHVKKARLIFLNDVESMLNNPMISKIKIRIKQQKENSKVIAIESLLANQNLDLDMIYERIGKYFKNKQNLFNILDSLNKNGRIIKKSDGRYGGI